jgi:hypothetical protein
MTNIWKNILIDKGDFEFNPADDDKNIALDDDGFSTIINIDSYITKSTNYDTKILSFIWDKIAFQKAQELSLLEAKNDEINWKNTNSFEENFENFKTKSTITKVTDEEHNFQIENTDISTTLILIPYVILNINYNGKIQYCSKIRKNQRPLVQLIGI